VLVIQVAGGIILVVLILAYLLRGRFAGATLRTRASVRPTLPPSPYQPSRGFRILDGSEDEEVHRVQLPRLDPNKEFIFNDHATLSGDVAGPVHLRHDEQWALERSMRRAPQPRVRRRRRTTWIIVLLALAVLVVVILIAGAHPHTPGVGLGPY
jgi:hypothetical protein